MKNELFNLNIVEYVLKSSYERSFGFLTSRDWIIAVVIYWVILSIFSLRGYKKKAFYIATLISYIFLMYMFTVFGRELRSGFVVRLKPFWSYFEIANGSRVFVIQGIFNILMFVPIGILLRLIDIWFGWAVLCAILLSYSIEFMQLIFKRGYFELFDDPFHNVLGVVLAYGVTSLIVVIGRRIARESDG